MAISIKVTNQQIAFILACMQGISNLFGENIIAHIKRIVKSNQFLVTSKLNNIIDRK